MSVKMLNDLSLRSIYQDGENAAHDRLCLARWPQSDGEESCPYCYKVGGYFISTRKKFKCKSCLRHYSLTTETRFSSRKISYSDILACAFIFVRAAKGISSIQLANTAGINQRTAWKITTLFRDAIKENLDKIILDGTVEIDGATFGGHTRLFNTGLKGNNSDNKYVKRYGNRRVVVVAKQRMGRTIPFIARTEGGAKKDLIKRLSNNCTLVVDGAHAWDGLAALYEMLRVEHAWSFSANNACTNNAESFFAGLRKMHTGTHHHIGRDNLIFYASELAWKRDMKEVGMTPDMMTDELLSMAFSTQNETPSARTVEGGEGNWPNESKNGSALCSNNGTGCLTTSIAEANQ